MLAPIQEISAELPDRLDATNPLGGIHDGGAHVEFDVSVRKRPTVGFVPKLPKELPAGSVIWNVISLSQEPELNVNATMSLVYVETEPLPVEPFVIVRLLTIVPFTATSIDAPFHPSP